MELRSQRGILCRYLWYHVNGGENVDQRICSRVDAGDNVCHDGMFKAYPFRYFTYVFYFVLFFLHPT